MIVRKLNAEGIHIFEEYLQARRNGQEADLPKHILDDGDYTENLSFEVKVENIAFANRLEMAEYLSGLFEDAPPAHEKDLGLWTWIALYYFEQLCPSDKTPNRSYQYILRGDENYKHYYRHLVNGPYRLYQIHGNDARAMLAQPVDIHPDLAEQIASRQEIVTNEALMQVVDYMYWNPDRKNHKRGVTNRGEPGTVRRLVRVHDQLERTYDIAGMEADQIKNLLPPEFETWFPEGGIPAFDSMA
jgi:hypothetical protein